MSSRGFANQQSPSSVSKSNANRPRSPHHLTLRIDGLEMADGVGHIHGDDRFATQRNHHAEAAGGYEVDSGHAETRGQNAIEGRGWSSALNVPEHANPHFFVRTRGDGIAEQ